MKNQDNKYPPEATNPIVLGSKESILAEVQDKDFKIAVMSMFRDLKDNVNKWLNEDWETTNSWDEIMKPIQDMKTEFNKEIQSLKEAQTEIK